MSKPVVHRTWKDVLRLCDLSSPDVRRGCDIGDNSLAVAPPRLGLKSVEPEQVRVTPGYARRMTIAKGGRGAGIEPVSRRDPQRGALRLGRQLASPQPSVFLLAAASEGTPSRCQPGLFAASLGGDKRKLTPTANHPGSPMQDHTVTTAIGEPISAPRFPRAKRTVLSASFRIPTRPPLRSERGTAPVG